LYIAARNAGETIQVFDVKMAGKWIFSLHNKKTAFLTGKLKNT